jgi:hypothetical protein
VSSVKRRRSGKCSLRGVELAGATNLRQPVRLQLANTDDGGLLTLFMTMDGGQVFPAFFNLT